MLARSNASAQSQEKAVRQTAVSTLGQGLLTVCESFNQTGRNVSFGYRPSSVHSGAVTAIRHDRSGVR